LNYYLESEMTYLEVAYRYQTPPGEAELRAIDSLREVYGIQRVQFNEKERTVRVLFDASRLKADVVAKLLRAAGIDLREQLVVV
jgi:copper chaperone CopZ